MSPILLDTHAAVWAADGALRREVSRTITAAANRGELLLSPISGWEIGLLVKRGRLELASSVHDYVRALFTRPGVITAPITPAIAVASTSLPGTLHGDPADRILIATAATLGAGLVTRDARLHAYAKATKHIRCLAC